MKFWLILACLLSFDLWASRKMSFYFGGGTYGANDDPSMGTQCNVLIENQSEQLQTITFEISLYQWRDPAAEHRAEYFAQQGCPRASARMNSKLVEGVRVYSHEFKLSGTKCSRGWVYITMRGSKGRMALPTCQGKILISEDRGAIKGDAHIYNYRQTPRANQNLFLTFPHQINGGRPF